MLSEINSSPFQQHCVFKKRNKRAVFFLCPNSRLAKTFKSTPKDRSASQLNGIGSMLPRNPAIHMQPPLKSLTKAGQTRGKRVE